LSGSPIRIWSAGCSSGEEPYSIAVVLSEAIQDIGRRDVKILATDISDRMMEKPARDYMMKNRQKCFASIENEVF